MKPYRCSTCRAVLWQTANGPVCPRVHCPGHNQLALGSSSCSLSNSAKPAAGVAMAAAGPRAASPPPTLGSSMNPMPPTMGTRALGGRKGKRNPPPRRSPIGASQSAGIRPAADTTSRRGGEQTSRSTTPAACQSAARAEDETNGGAKMSTFFTPETRGELLAQIRSGMGYGAACESIGLSVNTGKGWLRRGRQEPDTEYGTFAQAVDAAREAAAAAEMTDAEFKAHLNTAVRRGSVQAMKLWLQLNGQPEHELDEIDGLRDRNQARRNAVPNEFDELDAITRLRPHRRNGHG